MPNEELDVIVKDLDKPVATSAELLERTVQSGAAMKAVAGKMISLGEKVEQGERILLELKRETQAIAERQAQAALAPSGNDGDLRRFVNKAGGLVVGGYSGKDRAGEIVIGKRDDETKGYQPGLLDADAPTVSDWHAELKQIVTGRTIAAFARKSEAMTGPSVSGPAPTPIFDEALRRHIDRAPPVVKAAITGASGAGANWMDVYTLPELGTRVLVPLQVAGLFPTLQMAAKTVSYPFAAYTPRAYKGGLPTEPTAQRTSSFPDSALSWTAEMFRTRLFAMDEIEEDAVFAFRSKIVEQLGLSLLIALDECLLHGDTTASHQDTGLSGWNTASLFPSDAVFGGTDDTRRCFKGLRKQAFAASQAADHSAQTTYKGSLDLCRLGMPGGMGLATQGDLVDVTSLKYLFGTIYADSNLVSVDKYGSRALVVAGEIGSAYGVRIVPSELMTADFAASGLYTASGTKTGHILVNRKGWMLGVRRGASTEVARDVTSGGTNLVAGARWAFGPSSSQVGCYYAYNL